MLMSVFTLGMSADETGTAPTYEYNTSNNRQTYNYLTGQEIVETIDPETGKIKYSNGDRIIYTAEDKLESMDLRFEKDGYQLYVDAYSGEVATRCIATGEVLFSNPYNVPDSTAKEPIKQEIMSQLVVKYVDITSGESHTFQSYTEAALRGQIVVRNIKNGIRVEYTIGRQEARMLVPRQIEKSAFETKILNIMQQAVAEERMRNFDYTKFYRYYELYDPSVQVSQNLIDEMHKAFPITKKMPVYVLDKNTTTTEIAKLEVWVKTFCPDYSYEELDEDHMKAEYVAEDKNPPLFKMALEYTLDDKGMTVRLPANGIRFNESLYQLYSVEILPYMGAGTYSNDEKSVFVNDSGYTFFPDGSGALFDFGTIAALGTAQTVTSKVYGQDYAYHTISGTTQEVVRYPVFGIVRTEDLSLNPKFEQDENAEDETLVDPDAEPEVKPNDYRTHGFVGIVEEGDGLMELTTYHAVRTSEYNIAKMTVYPRPQDTYNVADSISVGNNDTWTVVSSRKYTGNYKIRYMILTDEKVAAEKQVADYYECSYVGMAKAYREYLESTGVLTKLTDADVESGIPLFIETLGTLSTTQKILSIPVDVMTPLTTFDDIKTMYDDLAIEGITNVNFVLNGFTKGGLSDPQVPYRLSWDSSVVEDMDFEDLVEYAKEKGFGIYPDFDFAYMQPSGAFDGLSLKKQAVKTIDDRYTSKREYSSTKQTYMGFFEMAISPAYFSHFYNKLSKTYSEYGPVGIAVSTLGTDLNSDFDEDDPYNREDSKQFTMAALEFLQKNYGSVLTAGGNAYTWKYVDYITDVALDSSRYSQAYASVPFLGMVLHGYVEFAGEAINMEGNIEYAMLKAIESGASLKFILSYRNTSSLKNYDQLSRYYSIRYDIWRDDVADIYSELNAVLKDVQTSVISDHDFIGGVRVPDDDELISNASSMIDAAIEADGKYDITKEELENDTYRNARHEIEKIAAEIIAAGNKDSDYFAALERFNSAYEIFVANEEGKTISQVLSEKIDALNKAKAELDAIDPNTQPTEYAAKNTAYEVLKQDFIASGLGIYTTNYSTLMARTNALLRVTSVLCQRYKLATETYLDIVRADPNLPQAMKDDIVAIAAAIDPNAICAGNDIEIAVAEYVAKLDAIRTEMVNAIVAVEGDTAAGKHFAAGTFTLPEEYGYEIVPIHKDDELTYPEKEEDRVYESDDNKIVNLKYENGLELLLNFNNYKVKVTLEIDGVTSVYTLDAYGYMVVRRAN